MVSDNFQRFGEVVDQLLVESSDAGHAVGVNRLHLAILAIRLAVIEESLAIGGIQVLFGRRNWSAFAPTAEPILLGTHEDVKLGLESLKLLGSEVYGAANEDLLRGRHAG